MMNTAVALAPTPATISPARPIYLQATQKPAYKVNIIESFIEYIDRKDSTVKGYFTCLRQYAKWLNDNGIRLDETTREDVKAYRDYLASSGLAVGTQQQYLRAVKQLYKWAASEGLYINVADNVHGAKVRHDSHKKDALGREDVAKIADTIDRSDEQGKRLYAIYLLCITCGLRTIEINRANVEDIKTVGGKTYLYIQGKGHDDKDAPVLIIPEVKEALDDYFQNRSAKVTPKSPLFTSTSNKGRPGTKIYARDELNNYILDQKGEKVVDRISDGRIATTTISTMLKTLLVNAGYDSDRLTAHSLRHTSGTGAYMATGNIYLAQKHQRHADPATTEIYIHAEERDSRTTEQQVYNYYFRGEDERTAQQEALELIAALSPDKLEKVIDFIKMIK